MSHLLVALSEAAATIRYKRATRRNTPGPLGGCMLLLWKPLLSLHSADFSLPSPRTPTIPTSGSLFV